MNKRFVVILAVIGVVIVGAALFIYEREQSERPAATAQMGQTLLKDLKASDVASIVIREHNASLTLAKKDNRWSIVERNGFPADLDKVTELVVKSIALKVGQAEPIGEKDRGRLNLIEPGKAAKSAEGAATSIVFKAADGKLLAELLVGKKYFKQEPSGDSAKAQPDGRFVMLPTNPKQMYIVSEPFRLASTASADWVAKDGFAIARVKRLDVKLADAEGYRIERATDGPDWKLQRSGGSERLDISRANAAAYSLNKVEIDDLAAGAKPGEDGMDKPSVVTATTFDGLTYTLRIGRLQNDRYPVMVEVDGAPKRVFEQRPDEKPEAKAEREKSFGEELKQLEERVAREKGLKGHVLLVAKAKLADTLKKKSELLEQKKPAAK